MSDTEETLNGKGRRTDRDKSQVEHTPASKELFDWLEQLFYSEPEAAHFPEKLSIHQLHKRGKRFVVGECLKLYPFAPKSAVSRKAQAETGVQYMGANKPDKEELVRLSNQMLGIMKRDCDVVGQQMSYVVCAHHDSLSDEPYDRIKVALKPKDGKGADVEEEDDDDLPTEKRFTRTMHEEHRQFIGMMGGAFETIIDREHRAIKDRDQRIVYLEQQLQKVIEERDKARDQELDRQERRIMLSVKSRAADRGMALLESYAPMAMTKIFGLPAGGNATPAEVITLRNFLRAETEGGQLTALQANALFGDYDEATSTFKSLGILSKEQAQIIINVAYEKCAVEMLDQLMPGGQHPLSAEQFMRIQQVVPMDQLGPLFLIFQSRQQKSPQ